MSKLFCLVLLGFLSSQWAFSNETVAVNSKSNIKTSSTKSKNSKGALKDLSVKKDEENKNNTLSNKNKSENINEVISDILEDLEVKLSDKNKEDVSEQIDVSFDEDGYFIPNETQRKLIDSAYSLLGKKSLKFDKRSFNWDCSGTVLATYYKTDSLNFYDEYLQESGGGVNKMYNLAVKKDALFTDRLPEPGDLIFWDNTYDKNHNKKWDDLLTHVGIVIEVNKSGQITYMHHDYAKGIVKGYMNLNKPNVYTDENNNVINSSMRMKKDRYLNPSKWLSSHLFVGFAKNYN